MLCSPFQVTHFGNRKEDGGSQPKTQGTGQWTDGDSVYTGNTHTQTNIHTHANHTHRLYVFSLALSFQYRLPLQMHHQIDYQLLIIMDACPRSLWNWIRLLDRFGQVGRELPPGPPGEAGAAEAVGEHHQADEEAGHWDAAVHAGECPHAGETSPTQGLEVGQSGRNSNQSIPTLFYGVLFLQNSNTKKWGNREQV